MEKWPLRDLSQLGSIGRGRSRHRPRNAPHLYGGRHPLIQTADIMKSEFYISNYSQTYSDDGLAQSKLWNPNTLCITNAGANTGESAILSFHACFPDSIIGFVADEGKADVRYVKYFLDSIIHKIKSITRGATQDNLSMEKLLSFKMPTPPLPVQQKIASVLYSIDKEIQNLKDRVEIRETIAQNLFDEWFEKLHHPNIKPTTFVESELGPVPSEWSVKYLSEYVEFERGVEPGSKSYSEVEKPGFIRFLRVGDLSERRSHTYVPIGLTKGKSVKVNDILISLDGTVGIVKTGYSGCFSTGLRKCKIVKDEISMPFLYFTLKSKNIQSTILAHASGATILHASSSIKFMKFVLPPKYLIEQFTDFTRPLFQLYYLDNRRIELLRDMRDLLRLKLFSGEIDVSNLDIEVIV